MKKLLISLFALFVSLSFYTDGNAPFGKCFATYGLGSIFLDGQFQNTVYQEYQLNIPGTALYVLVKRSGNLEIGKYVGFTVNF